MNTITQVTDTQITDLAADLTGFHPLLDTAVAALAALAEADLTADQSHSLVAALGAFDGTNATTLTALVLRRIANPDANLALAYLPADRQQTLRRLGAEYAAATDDDYACDTAAEIAGVIDHS